MLKLDRSGLSVWLNIITCFPSLTENTPLRSCCSCLLRYSNSNFKTFCLKFEPSNCLQMVPLPFWIGSEEASVLVDIPHHRIQTQFLLRRHLMGELASHIQLP